MAHAPYAIFGDMVFVYARTTKTACGRRVATIDLTTRDATDCVDCQRRIASDREEFAELERIARELGIYENGKQCHE